MTAQSDFDFSNSIIGTFFIDDASFEGSNGKLIIGSVADDCMVNDGLGDDEIDGGSGIDTFHRNYESDYGSFAFKAAINLEIVTISSPDFPEATPDYIKNIENVVAEGAFDYIFTGDSNEDDIASSSGQDIIIGGAGSDTLNGGAGNDVLTGGIGSNSFQFSGDFGSDIITDFSLSNDNLAFFDDSGIEVASSILTESANIDGDLVLTASNV